MSSGLWCVIVKNGSARPTMQKLLTAVLFVVLASTQLQAAPLTSEADVDEFVQDTMNAISSEGVEIAFERLREHTPDPDSGEFEAWISTARVHESTMQARVGTPIGNQLIRVDHASDSLTRYVYIQKYKTHASTWKLYFYRGEERWYFNGFQVWVGSPAAFD